MPRACSVPLSPPADLLGSPGSPVTITGGGSVAVPVPAAWNAIAVVGQVIVKTSGSPTKLTVDTPAGSRLLVNIPGTLGGGAAAVIPVTGDGFVLRSSAAKVTVAVRAWSYLTDPACFVDSGAAQLYASEGAMGLGASAPVSLVQPGFLDSPLKSSLLAVHVAAPTADSTVTLSTDGKALDKVVVRKGSAADLVLPVPPTESGVVDVVNQVGAPTVTLNGLGYFTDSIAYFAEPAQLAVATGLSLPKSDPAVVNLPEKARDASSVFLRVTAEPLGAVAQSVTVWTAGTAKPVSPTVTTATILDRASQVIALAPGAQAQLLVKGDPGAKWTLSVLGWSSMPPAVNVPADSTTIAEVGDIAVPASEDATQPGLVSYAGAEPLKVGDVIVSDVTDELPNGLLSIVTAVEDGLTGGQQVALQPAELSDAVPAADIAETGEIATLAPDPIGDPAPAPEDVPPGEEPAPAASATSGGAQSLSAQGAPLGLKLPKSVPIQCSGGGPSLSMSLGLSGEMHLNGTWSWRGVSSVDFGASVSLTGSVNAFVGANITCQYSTSIPVGKLPTIRFSIGPVPVVIVPEVSLEIQVTGKAEAGISAGASISAGVSAGVKWQGGNYTPYFNRNLNMGASFDAKASASLDFFIGPKLTFKLYGANVGPYVRLGGYLTFTAATGQSPWWKMDGGIRGGVGLFGDILSINFRYESPSYSSPPTRYGQSSSAYPGPTITTSTMPSGQASVPYDAAIGSSGGTGPMKWYMIGGSLPPGLSFRQDGHIVGSNPGIGSTTFTVRAIDARGYRSVADRTIGISVGSAPPPVPDYCPGGDYSGSAYDGTCGSPPPPSSNVTVAWGSRAPASYCGGDTSCTFVTVNWANLSSGNHTITPFFDGAGNWCAGASCSSSIVRSGSSGSFTGYWAAGYCRQSHTVTATVDGIRSSNSINTIDHGC